MCDELSARGGDVVSHRPSDGGGNAGVFEHFLKGELSFQGALREGIALRFIIRNEIDLNGDVGRLGKADQFFGVLFLFVYIFKKNVLKGNMVSARWVFSDGASHPLGELIEKVFGG